FEVFREDSRSGFEILDAFEPWYVVEDAARDNSVLHGQDGVPSHAALVRDHGPGYTVPHFAVKEDVRERIQVRGPRAVDARITDAIHNHGGSVHGHRPLDWTGVVDLLGRVRVTGERN